MLQSLHNSVMSAPNLKLMTPMIHEYQQNYEILY